MAEDTEKGQWIEPEDVSLLPICPHEEGDTKYFEYRIKKGEMCKFFPYTNMYQSLATRRIVANDGGRIDFDGEVVKKRWSDRREAILQGLTEAALQEGIGSTPNDMLAEIVKNQALQATEQTRDGTGAAKFVLGIMEVTEDKVKSGEKAVVIEMNVDAVREILEKLAERNESA